MEHVKISNHQDLMNRINYLVEKKHSEEVELKNSFKGLIYSISPFSIIKNSIRGLTEDKETNSNLSKIALTLGTDFIIEKFLGKNKSIKGFLSSLFVEKIASIFINKAIPNEETKTDQSN